MFAPWKKSYEQPRQLIKKQRHYFADKGPSSQSYSFSSSRVWLWELDYKESWVLQNWCFLTVVLEKTLESPLDCKEIQPVRPKGNQSWIFIGRTDAEAEAPYFGYLMQRTDSLEKTLKDRRQEEKGMTEDEMVGWYRRLDGHEFEQLPGVGKQDWEACSAAVHGGRKELDVTEWLNWWFHLSVKFIKMTVKMTVKWQRSSLVTYLAMLLRS